MKRYLLLGVIVTLLAVGSYSTQRSFLAPSTPASAVSKAATGESPEVKPPEIAVKPQSPSKELEVLTPATPPTPNVTLSVAGESYAAFAPQGSTVLDAMRILTSTTNFVFTGREYPSLGFFVESINGRKAESGHSWILYVNGKLSGTGASQMTLNAGDAIEWRDEVSY
ncbi:DUF4430 domain-containing protein [Candidatus Kaiserbacteria bacterium]|nr:DUF4430 domain-containing protein [Candidatus Kaiserbacteria bacterium]